MDRVLVQPDQAPLQHRNAQSGRFRTTPHPIRSQPLTPNLGCSAMGGSSFRAIRDVDLAHHVAVIGDAVAPFMAPLDTDPAALRAADSLAILPDDPAAAAEEIQRRREETGFSYFRLRCRRLRGARAGRR